MERLKHIRKLLWHALLFNLIFSTIGIIYGTILLSRFSLLYLFTANFLAGAIIVLIGVVVFIIPIRPKGKLIDHSTVGETMMEMREKKRKKSLEIIYLGMFIILIPALIQLFLSLVL